MGRLRDDGGDIDGDTTNSGHSCMIDLETIIDKQKSSGKTIGEANEEAQAFLKRGCN